MKTVNIAELKNRLSTYLQHVRNGEEIVVRDRDLPIARIVPLSVANLSEEERQLVASGALKLPERAINWDEFWSLPAGHVSREIAVQVVLDERGESR